ncbi:MAG: endonuclease MutS2, partial [Clostridia bacterium]|nr:endonuclease MutS2 [Clostridia bacterium]
MSFPDERTSRLLEFDKIRETVSSFAATEGAKRFCLELAPSGDPDDVRRSLSETEAALSLLREKGRPPFGSVKDIRPSLEMALRGGTLGPRELLDVAEVLRVSRALTEYSVTNRRFETVIDGIFARLICDRTLENRIAGAIVSEDTVADTASPELATIRLKLRNGADKIRDALARFMTGESSKYLQDNIITTRGGRYVVPVRAEYKNAVRGIVHDTSSSGATVFIEPMAVVEANNEIRELEIAEKREIERILSELSAEVAAKAETIRYDCDNVDELSVLFAKAGYAESIDARAPRTESRKRVVKLNKARHPLIDRDSVGPVDIRLGGDFDTLVITGPNTGGKTVTLKTLGLFSLMAQSGLLLPVGEGSAVCVFDKVLVDLGDAQSIERSLSTFSSHMVNIVGMIGEITPDSLVLFDELGAGTDPVEGAALAIAIIEEVRSTGALCAATTHYAELKTFSLVTPGVSNASCEFDVETLRPTYRLIIGTPGRSCALAISERLGLPGRIIERAKNEISSENRRFEDVIESLDQARIEADRRSERLAAEREDFERFRAEAEKETKKKLAEAEAVLDRASEKASRMVEGARVTSEFVLTRLEEAKRAAAADKTTDAIEQTRRAVRERLRDTGSEYSPSGDADSGENDGYVLPRPLKKGDRVWVVSLKKEGVVLSDPSGSDRVRVSAGTVRMNTSLSNLRLAEDAPAQSAPEKEKKVRSGGPSGPSRSVVRDEIDLRGMTGDEAWIEVDRYLDAAALSGLQTVRLIHGKGTGALKAALWGRIRHDPRIASFRIGG